MDRVAAKLRGKKDKFYFLYDNARPHIAKSTREKLLELGWTVLSHPPYPPDLAPTDYKLFHSLENYLDKKKFNNEQGVSLAIANFFDQKSPEFYEQGILSLPEHWRQVIDNDGTYIIET